MSKYLELLDERFPRTGEETGPIEDVFGWIERQKRVENGEWPYPDDRYVVVLLTPDAAERIAGHRSRVGLRVYVDRELHEDVGSLDEALELIEEHANLNATLVEHRADVTYWTAGFRDDRAHA